MDRMRIRNKIRQIFDEYKYVILILLVGILIMLIPVQNENLESDVTVPTVVCATDSLEKSLSELLSKIEGAGRVEVLLTQAQGERKLFQTDIDPGYQDSQRISTVIITDAGKNQQGLIQQTIPPVYLGAIVLCQGSDNASVKYDIVNAVANVTGLTTDKISVIKMK